MLRHGFHVVEPAPRRTALERKHVESSTRPEEAGRSSWFCEPAALRALRGSISAGVTAVTMAQPNVRHPTAGSFRGADLFW